MQNLFINIREATLNDIPAIMQIENLCFPHGAWKEENILQKQLKNTEQNIANILEMLYAQKLPKHLNLKNE